MKIFLLLSICISSFAAETFIPHYQCHWTPTFSEEMSRNSGIGECKFGYAMVGLECSGTYCDNMRLKCCQLPGLPDHRTFGNWFGSDYIYQGDSANMHMSYGGSVDTTIMSHYKESLVTALQCDGANCKNLRFIFHSFDSINFKFKTSETPGHCTWYENRNMCANYEYVAGLSCKGERCSSFNIMCCKVKKN